MSTTTAVAIVVRIKYPGVPESDVLSLQLVTIRIMHLIAHEQ